jgi:predicted regulator of Ras-like GTPase activity (Roadblock/LC7/MglB family)
MAVFKEVLTGIRDRVEGTRALSIIDLEGIAVETVSDGEVSIDTLGAEFGGFLKSVMLSNTELNTGSVEQFSLVTDRYVIFLSSVTGEYFILLVLDRDGNYGRARFELLKARNVLREELS